MNYCNGKKDTCDRGSCVIGGTLCEHYDGTGSIKVLTNADRIRAMTDEELRNWLFQRDCKNIAAFLQHGGAGVMDAAQLLDWLQQPAEEAEHGHES